MFLLQKQTHSLQLYAKSNLENDRRLSSKILVRVVGFFSFFFSHVYQFLHFSPKLHFSHLPLWQWPFQISENGESFIFNWGSYRGSYYKLRQLIEISVQQQPNIKVLRLPRWPRCLQVLLLKGITGDFWNLWSWTLKKLEGRLTSKMYFSKRGWSTAFLWLLTSS